METNHAPKRPKKPYPEPRDPDDKTPVIYMESTGSKPEDTSVIPVTKPPKKPAKRTYEKRGTRLPGVNKEDQLKLEKRRAIVASNILAGLGYRDIAVALDVSIGTIANDVSIILGRWQEEQVRTVSDIKTLENRRLDTMLNVIYSKAKEGSLGHIDRVIRIGERKAKIFGSDAPEEQNIHMDSIDPDDYTDEQLAEIIEAGIKSGELKAKPKPKAVKTKNARTKAPVKTDTTTSGESPANKKTGKKPTR